MALPDFRIAGTISGNSPEVRVLPAHSSGQTYTFGQCVKLTSGRVEEATSGDIPIGVALEPGSGKATDDDVLVALINEDTIFEADCDADTAITDIGVLADLVLTGGVHQVDIGASTDDCFKVRKVLSPADATNRLVHVTAGPGVLFGA